MDIDFIEIVIKEAYDLTDKAIEKNVKENNVNFVCCKGCSICCEDMELPILNFEMLVIQNYIKNLCNSEIKDGLINSINVFNNRQHGCPFLVNKICGIYEVRPIVCRIFYMQQEKCISREDLRKKFENGDVVNCFNRAELLDAIICLHKLYGIENKMLFRKLLDEGFFENNTKSLFDFDIKNII